ncbi:MAG TPA: radical SAM protein [Candidatus Omnitrophota bacterium]|mgnify:CR=1 FL=1|nr:radical SAM protein [Candidatus Omnitrophota bacterium]
MKTHYTIPFFIPHEGCPFTCIFCSQKKISGRTSLITGRDIRQIISEHLKTIPRKGVKREVAFFGGSFTALPVKRQKECLEAVRPFIRLGSIDAIRISTRPDFIDDARLAVLKRYGVRTIELGVQSLADDVLTVARRGHSAEDVIKASRLIKRRGFRLGHQLMVGLPGSTALKEEESAVMSCRIGADEARIYPVLVVKGTALAAMWRRGSYRPLTESSAIKRSARLVRIYRDNDIKVLRVGLHPSRDLLSGKAILAGPFHEAFGQKVETYRCGNLLMGFLSRASNRALVHIRFNPSDAASVIGYKRLNAARVEAVLKRHNVFTFDKSVPEGVIMAEFRDGRRTLIGKF